MYLHLTGIYEDEGKIPELIITLKKAEKLYLKDNDLVHVAKVRKNLRIFYKKYGYKPEDFDFSKNE